ncbi:stromal cell-derived factor 2 isoform X2 [Acinonyx jubatus]|uniref:Stromal cell-derived factor 2 isoform X2 n=1 Tax=Acinonyx jubatus TaxID=32536 RepID=A0A6J0A3Z3_ACIJB|nr:stromal cell-derived factor 2 isoform X2 [Acinonyx jubatus]
MGQMRKQTQINHMLRALQLVNDRDGVRTKSVQFQSCFQLLQAGTTQCGRDRHVENYSSGQQSVTGVTSVDDSNSYWRIRGKTATVCERGTPIRCGQPIRLTHVNTGRNLHSHHFTSPLSGNQEVSAFGEEGEGDYLDDWTVLCNGPYWVRDGEVRFKHSSTEVLLSVTGEQYGRPISGQKEVHGMAQPSQNNYWKTMEGIFMKPTELLKTEVHHAEL